ncbi:MAG: hypothetical protein L0Y58_01430 [Verrucomicrobia subdivision 3 bacterium]|nr:hypothetical protein [Limisphaerales bacterium]
MKPQTFHSFLSAACLAVMTWVGYETVESGKSIAALKTELAALNGTLAKLERKLDDTVPRREYESRILQLQADLKLLLSRMRDFESHPKIPTRQ